MTQRREKLTRTQIWWLALFGVIALLVLSSTAQAEDAPYFQAWMVRGESLTQEVQDEAISWDRGGYWGGEILGRVPLWERWALLARLGTEGAPGAHVFTAADIGKFRFRFFAELMRAASFTRALGLSAKEFVILARLFEDMSSDLFESPTQVFDLLEIVDLFRGSGLPSSQLAWLLRHDYAEQYTDDEGAVGRALAELARGLRTIAAETAELLDPDGVATKLNLASVITDSNDLDAVMGGVLTLALHLIGRQQPGVDEGVEDLGGGKKGDRHPFSSAG